MTRRERIGLLASVASQPSTPSPAIDLYRSADFLAARKAVESSCGRWFVLSPRHGLVAPGDWIEPYQETLAEASEAERKQWSERILAELEQRLGSLKGVEFELHVSDEYRESGLVEGLKQAGAKVSFGVVAAEAEGPEAEVAAPASAEAAAVEVAPSAPAEPPEPEIFVPRISPAELERERRELLAEFYSLLDEQADIIGGHWSLPDCSGDDHWPEKGVIFFFEPDELREDGESPRVVRVSSHALTPTSKVRLWDRLRADRGTISGRYPGAGNHRTSALRRHIGRALIARGDFPEAEESWGRMTGLTPEVKEREIPLEVAVSEHIAKLTFVWMGVEELEDRIAIERGAIALLSNLERNPIDPPSEGWLGHYGGEVIAGSGLWNQEHTGELPDAEILALLRKHLDE